MSLKRREKIPGNMKSLEDDPAEAFAVVALTALLPHIQHLQPLDPDSHLQPIPISCIRHIPNTNPDG